MNPSAIDIIVRALHFVEHRFADGDDHYRNEWLNREPFAF